MPPRCEREQGKWDEVRLQEGWPGHWGRGAAEGEARGSDELGPCDNPHCVFTRRPAEGTLLAACL